MNSTDPQSGKTGETDKTDIRRYVSATRVPNYPIPREQVDQLPPHIARAYFACWSGDLKAGMICNRMAERELHRGNLKVAARLMRINHYLRDRIGYEMNPPTRPDQWPILNTGEREVVGQFEIGPH